MRKSSIIVSAISLVTAALLLSSACIAEARHKNKRENQTIKMTKEWDKTFP